MIFILLQKLLYHISKQCRPLSDIFFIHNLPCVYVGSALIVKFLYMGAMHYWANCLCSNNVEMYFLSALKVYASSVNNLSVISERFMNFWVEPVLSRTYKGHSRLASTSLEQVALQILLLVILAICSYNYSSYEKPLGKYIPPPDSAKTQRVVLQPAKRLRQKIFSQNPKSS